ncbi:hypothetical protein B0H17DRAFT_1152072 [Mycena rosella]|uniref:Uncharacterized protein n=1 Tax=Mycena rosella TaxID=1033263 RepID=A0AAD7BFS7_MYCRO|nr:hypothetical protein B0H17DRAFT_1152072 [Mycena rosella]
MRPIIVAMFIGLMLFTLQIKFAKGVLADVHPKYNLFGMGTRHSLLCSCDLVTNKWIEQARLGPCSSQLTLTDLYIGNMEHLDLPEAIGSLPYMALSYHIWECTGQSKSVGSCTGPNEPVQSISAATVHPKTIPLRRSDRPLISSRLSPDEFIIGAISLYLESVFAAQLVTRFLFQ